MQTALGKRIGRHCALLPEPIYVLEPDKAGQYLSSWSFCGELDEPRNYLTKHVTASPESIFTLMKCFLGTAWAMTTGLPIEADFERHSYDAMASLIDPETVAKALLSIYGDRLNTPQFHLSNHEPRELRVAHQFMFIRKRIFEEEKAQIAQAATRISDQEEQATDRQG